MARRLVYTSTKVELATLAGTRWYAYQHNGDFIHVFLTGKVYRLFEDGSLVYSCTVETQLRTPIIGNLNHNLVRFGSDFYRMDQSVTGRRELVIQACPLAVLNGAKRCCWLEANRKIILVKNDGSIDIYTLTGVTLTGPVSAGFIDGVSNTGWALLIRYRLGLVCAYNATNGRIAILRIPALLSTSANAAKIKDTSLMSGLTYLCWSEWNEVFWGAIESSGLMKIWTDLVQPTDVSNIQLLDAAPPLHSLQGTRLRTRVTSDVVGRPIDAFEPVANWLVDWSFTGPGFLQKVQSRTDINGYALNFYFGPLTGVGLPQNVVINATIND